jgi:Rad3-related DNA helicase
LKTFEELGVSEEIRRAIEELGFENPMPVQEEVIPYLLGNKNDVIALAQTGTGKTASYGIPVIQKTDANSKETQAVILSPTRELCLQIADDLNSFAKYIDYYAEPIMHELLSEKDFGKYQDKNTGKMQLCFLTNNDITGGNSGSPMFNGKGELIGLAFDGNWDSLSSDINFDKRLARCIGVDIRYVLYLMDKWGHADRLLKEINAK